MPDATADDPQSSDASEMGESSRVLVVDDHVSMCRIMKQQLEREGHQVSVAHSVSQGRIALSERFDVAVLDVDLPDGQGFELVEELRRNATSPTSVVMITGSPNQENLQSSLHKGVHEILFKPFKYAEVRDAVSRALAANRRWHERLAILEGRRLEPAASGPKLGEAELTEVIQALVDGHGLTDREREILDLILRGLQNSEIASQLQISANTVKYHVRNLLTKLGMESRTELFRSLLKGD